MSRRRSIIGVLTVIALCMGAIGVTNAFAEQTGYTLHECVAKGSGGTGVIYTANCVEKSATGTFETKPIETPKEVAATSTSNFVLSTTVGGVNFVITCTSLEAMPTVTNVLTGEFMHVKDEGVTRFTGCTVTAPLKSCVVSNPAPGGTKGILETVNLKSDTTATGSTKFEPAAGTTFIEIEVSGCTVAALNGIKNVTGTATSSRETGITQAFTATSGSALFFGGQAATLTGKYHLATTTGGSGTLLSLEKAGE
jgi:hypothetical protein